MEGTSLGEELYCLSYVRVHSWMSAQLSKCVYTLTYMRNLNKQTNRISNRFLSLINIPSMGRHLCGAGD